MAYTILPPSLLSILWQSLITGPLKETTCSSMHAYYTSCQHAQSSTQSDQMITQPCIIYTSHVNYHPVQQSLALMQMSD